MTSQKVSFKREFLSAGLPDFTENILKIYLRGFTAAARDGFTVDEANNCSNNPKVAAALQQVVSH